MVPFEITPRGPRPISQSIRPRGAMAATAIKESGTGAGQVSAPPPRPISYITHLSAHFAL